MSRLVPSEIIEEIKARLDIVDIVSEHVVLRRTPKNFIGLCPFHTEKSPSFTVSQEKQIFHCFGCGKGGDLFSFYMAMTNATFTEALEVLASQAGIELPSYEKAVDDTRDRLFRANEAAMRIYHRILMESPEGKQALEYLRSRSIEVECMKEFRLGFAPAGWKGIAQVAGEQGEREDVLFEAGLLSRQREGNALRDLFRNRIVFPIMDVRSRVIGFGGRSLDGREPKYLNTPETKIFSKGQNLYGIHLAKNEIRGRRESIVVEGYMDLLVLHQTGYLNAIAPLGTALTEKQAAMLTKMCDAVYLMYDGDQAGKKAAFRAGNILLSAGLLAKIVFLPAGEDPASFVSAKGRRPLDDLMKQAKDVIESKIAIFRDRGSLRTVEGKRAVVRSLMDSLAGAKDPLLTRLILEKCAQDVGVPIGVLAGELEARKARERRPLSEVIEKRKTTRTVHDLTERYLLLLLMLEQADGRSFQDTVSMLAEDDFLNDEYRIVFQAVKDVSGRKGNVVDLVLSRLPVEMHSLVSAIVMDERAVQNPEKMLSDCLLKFRARRIRKNLDAISGDLRAANGTEREGEADRLARRFYDLAKELSSLFSRDEESR
jgi:DNA primase